MNKTLLSLFLFSLPLYGAFALQPINYPERDKTDLDVVDHYLHPFNGADSMGMEREILIRGPKPGIVKALIDAYDQGVPRSRDDTPWMLERLRAPQAVPFFIRVLKTEKTDGRLLGTIIGCLGDMGGPQAAQALEAFYRKGPGLSDKSDSLRLQALVALGSCRVPSYRALLRKEAARREGLDRLQILGALGRLDDPSARREVLKFIAQTQDPKMLNPAIGLLGDVGKPEDLKILNQLKSQSAVEISCADSLKLASFKLEMLTMTDQERADALASYVGDITQAWDIWATDRLADLGTPQALDVLKLHLNDPSLGNSELEVLIAVRKAGKGIVRVVRPGSDLLKIR